MIPERSAIVMLVPSLRMSSGCRGNSAEARVLTGNRFTETKGADSMPVHDLGYRAWQGQLQSRSLRWWAIADTGIRLAWRGHWLRRLLIVAWLPALYIAMAFLFYEQWLRRSKLTTRQSHVPSCCCARVANAWSRETHGPPPRSARGAAAGIPPHHRGRRAPTGRHASQE